MVSPVAVDSSCEHSLFFCAAHIEMTIIVLSHDEVRFFTTYAQKSLRRTLRSYFLSLSGEISQRPSSRALSSLARCCGVKWLSSPDLEFAVQESDIIRI